MLALLATDAGVSFVDDNQGWAGAGELGATTVGLDIVETDHSVWVRLEQALRGGQTPFKTTRFGRRHGDSIDIEFFREFRDPLIHEMWRAEHRKAVDNFASEQLADDKASVERKRAAEGKRLD